MIVCKQKNRAITYSVFVVPAGLEPAAHGLENRCSIQLSYGTISLNCLPIFGDANKRKKLNLKKYQWKYFKIFIELLLNQHFQFNLSKAKKPYSALLLFYFPPNLPTISSKIGCNCTAFLYPIINSDFLVLGFIKTVAGYPLIW